MWTLTDTAMSMLASKNPIGKGHCMTESTSTSSAELLAQHADGDPAALQALLVKHLDWLRTHASRRLGAALRKKADTGDIVQEAVLGFLKYGPKVSIESEGQLRQLLLKVVENTICDRHGYFTAKRRDMAREAPLPSSSVVELSSSRHPHPADRLERHETEAEVRLALELLPPTDREIVVRRLWEQQPFDQIATALESTPDAVRMRFRRALAQLSNHLVRLRQGEI